ncbi:MAG: sulfurtransferase [Gemmatimonadales bacterium]
MIQRFCPRALAMVAATLLLAAPNGWSQSQTDRVSDEAMGTLVTTEWLSQHLDDPDLVVLDCTVRMAPNESGGIRTVSGRTDYEAGHIPSAGFADLKGELSDVIDSLDFVLPTPEAFSEAMGALGVGDDSKVVLYDGYNSMWATRVWWMLRWIGFDQAAVLDGGLGAWTSEERPLSTEPANHAARTLTPAVRPELVAYRDEVLAAIEDDAVSIIDVLPEPHFRGDVVMYGRPGHIPSAINISSMSLFDDSGRFRSRGELDDMFPGDHEARVITYCGAGVAASASAFAMTRLGFTDVAVYMGSLQEWAADPSNPLVVNGAEGLEPAPDTQP